MDYPGECPVVRGDLWQAPPCPGMIVLPVCAEVQAGELVLSRGHEHQAAMRIPNLPYLAARALAGQLRMYADEYTDTPIPVFGFVPLFEPQGSRLGLGLFQERHYASGPVIPGLVHQACLDLAEYVDRSQVHVRMPYPCQGFLPRQFVEPYRCLLPERVVWVRK